jgi:hypothetical protein
MNLQIECDGYAIVRNLLGEEERRELINALGPLAAAGRRGLLGLKPVASIARSARSIDVVRPHLRGTPIPVRAIYFDKSTAANWLVPWHQDLSLAVRERRELPGFGTWSIKDGIPHVQPPTELLEQMLTIRLHLDPADESNGALRVLPGSHRRGRLSPEQIQAYRAENSEVVCSVSAGDALLMRPLLLHASSRSTSDVHRRVLHIEYSGFALPPGLAWHDSA